MQVLTRPWGAMHFTDQGRKGAPVVVFANSLGTDLRLWDLVLPILPAEYRYVRYDKRGHGLSDLGGEADLAALAEDLIALIEHIGGPVILVGLSIGGLIAQRVAADRPDLLRGLVLSNTAAKLGTSASWSARIAAVQADGVASIADAVMERWFSPAFRATAEVAAWRNMLGRTTDSGYIAACMVLAEADQTEATSRLRLPTLVIAGAEDGATPVDVVKATAALIPGAAFHVISGAGHLPCVEAPAEFAAVLTPFLKAHAND